MDSFVGKLNSSKGYDIYKEAIIKILDEFKDWNALSIGDEERNRPYINHKRHKEIGFKSHKIVLKLLSNLKLQLFHQDGKNLGRTALESGSRGCATIISNKGGLPETTKHSIILIQMQIIFIIK